jgi:hypothetical protein
MRLSRLPVPGDKIDIDAESRLFEQAKATGGAKRAAIGALPFAKASAPDHVLSIADKGQDFSPDSHNCSKLDSAKVG